MTPERIEVLRDAAKDAINNGGRVTLEAKELIELLPQTAEESKGPEADHKEAAPVDSLAPAATPESNEQKPAATEEEKPTIQ